MKLWIQHLLFNYNYELYLPKKEEINAKKILTKVWREKKNKRNFQKSKDESQ